MKDSFITNQETFEEISALKQRIKELERSEAEHRRTAEALRRSETKFRTLYDSASDAIILADETGFLDCNRATLEIYGCTTREAFCSMHPVDLSPPVQPCGTDSATLSKRHIAMALAKGRHRFEWEHKRMDTGETFPAEVWLTAMVLDGNPVLKAVVRNIADRKLTEEALQKERDFNATLIESSPAFILAAESNGTIKLMNDSMLFTLGYTREEVMGRDFISTFVPEGDREIVSKIISQLVNEAQPTRNEHRVLAKDGRELLVEWHGRTIRKPDGNPDYLFGIGTDTTERRRAERYNTALNDLYRQLLGDVDLPRKIKSIVDSVVQTLDADFARIWILKPGDLCNRGCPHASVQNGPSVCRDRTSCLHLTASSGRYTNLEGEHRRVPLGAYKIGRVASGEWPYFVTNDVIHDERVHDREWAGNLGLVSFAGYRLLSSDGNRPVGVLAMFSRKALSSDQEKLLENFAAITSQIITTGMIEKSLRESEERLRLLSDNIPNSMVYQVDCGEDGSSRRFTYVSAGVDRLHCVTAEAAKKDAMALYSQILDEDRVLLAKLEGEVIAAMSTYKVELRMRPPSGGTRWRLLITTPRRLADNHLVLEGIELDVTDRKQAAEEREELITELSAALSNVKTLQGLLPICSSCKKIRNDRGYWEQMEMYISEHSEAEFSHSICPECAQKLYPEFFKFK